MNECDFKSTRSKPSKNNAYTRSLSRGQSEIIGCRPGQESQRGNGRPFQQQITRPQPALTAPDLIGMPGQTAGQDAGHDQSQRRSGGTQPLGEEGKRHREIFLRKFPPEGGKDQTVLRINN